MLLQGFPPLIMKENGTKGGVDHPTDGGPGEWDTDRLKRAPLDAALGQIFTVDPIWLEYGMVW